MEEKVLSSSAVDDAKASLEQQFGSLFRGLPGIWEAYDLAFVWEAPEPEFESEAKPGAAP
jgi:hypothetical protein